MSYRLTHTLWIAGTLATLAWGAGAVGSKHAWGYIPLFYMTVALGASGLVLGRARLPHAFMGGLLLVGGAVAVQMAPFPSDVLGRFSPATVSLHQQQNLAAAAGAAIMPITIDVARTQLGLAAFASLALCALGASRLLTRTSTRQLAGAIAMLGVVVAVFGLIQKAVAPGTIYGLRDLADGGEPFGPFTNKNHFAGWMLMAIPLAVGLLSAFVSRGMQGVKPTLRDRLVWLASADASRTTLLGFAILTMALALVMTMSRSGMIALSAAFAIAAVTMSRRQSGAGRQVAVTGYLAAVTLLVVWWVGTDVIVTRFGSADALSISQRPAIWRDTVAIARDFWLTGTGLNTYGVSTLYYQTSVPDLHLNEAHNDYLQLAAEGGLLLGIPILLTIGAFVWHVRQRFREDVGSTWWVRMGAVTGILAVAVQSLAEFSLQRAGNAALFAVLCGIALHDGRPREHGSAVGVGRQRGVRENETDTACRPLVNGAALCA